MGKPSKNVYDMVEVDGVLHNPETLDTATKVVAMVEFVCGSKIVCVEGEEIEFVDGIFRIEPSRIRTEEK